MIDLINLWEATVQDPIPMPAERVYPEGTKPGAITFDRTTKQSSFEFTESPRVFFVSSVKTLSFVNFYEQLPTISLTPEEEQVRQQVASEQLAKNPEFYDGPQMLINKIIYSETDNVLFLQAVQAPYSFIVTLGAKRFHEGSKLYNESFFKTGVLASLRTSTGSSLVIERAKDGLFSAPGGFLEPKDGRLNFYNGSNLVIECARDELDEEIAGIKESSGKRLVYSRPEITAISLRKSAGPVATAEFVTDSQLTCDNAYLGEIIRHNDAKDAHEHTKRHELVPLYSQDRNELLELLLTGLTMLPGLALYLPFIISGVRKQNPDALISYPGSIPNTSSKVWPLSIFAPKLQPSLSISVIDDEEAEKIKKERDSALLRICR